MKLPTFKRLFGQDYSDTYKDLISKLSTSINVAFDNIYDALNKKISLTDNIACTTGTINLQVGSSGVPVQTASLALSTTTGVLGVSVINIKNVDNTTLVNVPINLNYNVVNNKFIITGVSGLTAGTNYTLTVVIWAN